MEDKDIKILETVVNYRKFDGIYSTNEVIFKAIENLLRTYKQDEKVIEEMASYLVKDCEQIEKLECEEIVKRLEKTPYNCIDCIISCFRKKCE